MDTQSRLFYLSCLTLPHQFHDPCILFGYKLLIILQFSSSFLSLQILQTAEALFEITLPRFSGDILPNSDAGIVLAIADR